MSRQGRTPLPGVGGGKHPISRTRAVLPCTRTLPARQTIITRRTTVRPRSITRTAPSSPPSNSPSRAAHQHRPHRRTARSRTAQWRPHSHKSSRHRRPASHLSASRHQLPEWVSSFAYKLFLYLIFFYIKFRSSSSPRHPRQKTRLRDRCVNKTMGLRPVKLRTLPTLFYCWLCIRAGPNREEAVRLSGIC